LTSNNEWLPPVRTTADGHERRVGVEVEFAGLEPEVTAECIQQLYGGSIEYQHTYELSVVDTTLGDFTIELDASYLKILDAKLQQNRVIDQDYLLEDFASDLLTRAAEQVVPWEVVAPPIPLSRLHELQDLMVAMRRAGALGTRYALRYAFGVHLNPELPGLDVDTLLNYFRAFLCLYDWIVDEEKIDFVRRLTTYIKHFRRDYIQLVVDENYRPDLATFIDDYLEENPTRNRSMDFLPLFAYLDEARVRAQLDDPRIKSRPTLHYRLPNCDIDSPQWNLDKPWREWLQVERLANDPDRLADICLRYRRALSSLTHPFDQRWAESTRRWLQR